MLKILVFSGVFFALIFKNLKDFDAFKPMFNINNYAGCKYLKTDIKGPEDMTQFNKSTIIVGSGNFQKTFSQGQPELEQQGIYAILNSHKKDYNVIKLKVSDFPANVALYVHGIYIRRQQDGDYLFAINHAYSNGGERIEVFSINEHLDLTYKYSIVMGQEFTGIENDLIVIEDDRFLVTTYMPLPDPIEGRHKVSFSHTAITFFYWLTKQRTTYVYDCKFVRKGVLVHPQCQQLKNTAGQMLNGITWNKKDTVWVADSIQKGFSEYKINNSSLVFARFIDIQSGIDNIEYQEDSNSLILGLIPRLYGFFQLESFLKKNELDRQTNFEYWGSIGQYDLNKNELNILAQNRYLSKGLAGGILSGNNLFLSSWCDISVMVCQKS